MNITAFPLAWPDGWPRTPSAHRDRGRYSVSFDRSRYDLLRELRLMGASNVVISSNIPLRNDGMPYANGFKRIADPGIAVYFVRKKQPQVVACDSWETVDGNIRAIGLTVAALRSIERAGASELLNRAFTGFKALPPAGGSIIVEPQWWDVLGVGDKATYGEAQSAYRKLAYQHHPDRGGDSGAMARINRAWEQAQAALQ